MAIVAFTFVLVLAIVLGAYFALIVRPETFERSKLLRRLGKSSIAVVKTTQLERPTERLSKSIAVSQLCARRAHVSGLLDALRRDLRLRSASAARHPELLA